MNPAIEYSNTRIPIAIKLPLTSNKNSEAYTVLSSSPLKLNCERNINVSATFVGMVKKCINFGLKQRRNNKYDLNKVYTYPYKLYAF